MGLSGELQLHQIERQRSIYVKAECARRGLKMADVLRELLEREFPKA